MLMQGGSPLRRFLRALFTLSIRLPPGVLAAVFLSLLVGPRLWVASTSPDPYVHYDPVTVGYMRDHVIRPLTLRMDSLEQKLGSLEQQIGRLDDKMERRMNVHFMAGVMVQVGVAWVMARKMGSGGRGR